MPSSNNKLRVNIPALGNIGSHEVTVEGLLRILVFVCHAIIVAFTVYIYGFAPLMRVKAAMIMALLCFASSLMALPMRYFTGTENLPILRWIVSTDIVGWSFLMYIGTAVSSAIGLVHSLNRKGLLSGHKWNCVLTAMILIWITLFVQSLVTLDILAVWAKAEGNAPEENRRKEEA